MRRVILMCVAGGALASLGCGGGVRRFPLKEPVSRDTDLDPVFVQCRQEDDPKEKVKKAVCAPDEYESAFAWDGANQMMFRPISRFFAVDPGGEALNVNALDEVPDSAWFTNRIGKSPMSADVAARGYCDEKVLDVNGPDGSWLIDMGKPNGANPGFRVKVEGVGKFMLKADPSDQPERATGATSIASRLYYAAGWWAPCDAVVYFRPSILKLKPGLKVTDNSGVTRDFDRAALTKVLANASHRGDLVRMTASRWLPGKTIGPFTYQGTRDDDPNDVIPHEDRRDLRGAKVIAAWLNHFDSREQNTMDTWMAANEKDAASSPGHVRHWYIDLGDCFGSEWDWEGISKRLGYAYYFDFNYASEDFVTFGVIQRPWERAQRSPEAPLFGFFHSRDFEPDAWRGGYPNPAFGRLTEHDGAWAARILARFTNEHVAAAVKVGDYTEPNHSEFLTHHLILRRDAILKRYFARLSPVGDVKVVGDATLCGTDLARQAGAYPLDRFRYSAVAYAGAPLALKGGAPILASPDGGVCATLAHVAPDGGPKDDDASRYVVVDLYNGQSRGPLRAHLYDLGPKRGFKLVGVERPDGAAPPRG
jgi:hypothetical protein